MLIDFSFAPALFLPVVLDIAISALYLLRLRRMQREALLHTPGYDDNRVSQRVFARLTQIALQSVLPLCDCLTAQD